MNQIRSNLIIINHTVCLQFVTSEYILIMLEIDQYSSPTSVTKPLEKSMSLVVYHVSTIMM